MDSKERFSKRAADYAKWRPSYPEKALDLLFEKAGLAPEATAADIGSGTGILSRLLAPRVAKVFAVEPNKAMREAAEAQAAQFPNIASVAGSAEETGLPDASIGFIAAAQAFHWFDRSRCKAEFRRVLKPEGNVALIWNARVHDGFGAAYDAILARFAGERRQVDHRALTDSDFAEFFDRGLFQRERLPYAQSLSFEGLLGRVKSCSYAPLPGERGFDAMKEALEGLFERFNEDGLVSFSYETELLWGRP